MQTNFHINSFFGSAGKRLAAATVCILLCHISAAGVNFGKLINEQHNYAKADKELDNQRDKMTTEEAFFEFNYWRCVLFCKQDYKNFNPLKAYNIANNLQRRLIGITDPKKLERLQKAGYTNESLRSLADTTCRYGLLKAEKANTVEAFNHYLHYFELARQEWKDRAQNKVYELAFERALNNNTETDYENFVTSYPYATQVPDAKARIETLAYELATKTNTRHGYEMFLSRFPETTRKAEVQDSIWRKAFRMIRRANKTNNYLWYAETYPNSPYAHLADSLGQKHAYNDLIVPGLWSSYVTFLTLFPNNKEFRKAASDSLLRLSQRDRVAKGLLLSLENENNPAKRSDLLKQTYALMAKDGEVSTLEYLKKNYPEVTKLPSFQKDLAAAKYAEDLDFRTIVPLGEDQVRLEQYIQMASDKDLAIVALQVLIRDAVKAKDWDKALQTMRKYGHVLGNNPLYKELVTVLERPLNPSIAIKNIAATNSKRGNQYYPIISADGKKLYFCGRDREDNLGGEDVFVTEHTAGGWTKPRIFAPLSSKNSNDGILAVSADGTQMLKFENGVMGLCTKNEEGWQPVEFFPPNINRGTWNSDATLCSDGKTLLFTSIRPSASDINKAAIYHGNNHYESDLYVSQRDSLGQWSEPVNLGPAINTMYSERTPFMHPDMRTLYFSSDGRGGLGGYDVYKSVRLSDTCWTCWSEPENLGKEINTDADDWTYKISTDGTTAYFSQKEQDSNESRIYSINLPTEQRPFKVVTVSGKMVDRGGKKVATKLMWEDLETHKIVGMAQSDPEDGSFFIVLPAGKMYGVFVSDTSVYPETRHVDLRKVEESVAVEKTFHVTTIEELKQGKEVTINNIFFEFGKSELLSYSYPELHRLARLLKKMNLNVEIGGHTDDVGSDEVNDRLSQARADAVRNFLISLGCNANAISAKGYGKNKPIAKNDTERGRAKNRRVEMRVIKD